MNGDPFEQALNRWAEAHRDFIVQEVLFAKNVVEGAVDAQDAASRSRALVDERAELDRLLGSALQLAPARKARSG